MDLDPLELFLGSYETMIKRIESEFKGYQNFPLYYQGWISSGSKGTLMLTHGQAEHSGCYERLAHGLREEWDLMAWDLRGHGKSEGKRGYAAHFEDYVKDWLLFFDYVRQAPLTKGRPFFTIGHSMGGLIQLMGLLKINAQDLTAQVLSSPLLKVAVPVPAYKEKAAHFLHKMWPSLTLSNEIKYENLTNDKEVRKTYASDPLRHDQISSGVYLGMLESMEKLQARVQDFTIPTLLQQAGLDKVVSRSQSEQFFAKLQMPKKSLEIYENSEHEIYNCIEREKAFADLRAFLNSFL